MAQAVDEVRPERRPRRKDPYRARTERLIIHAGRYEDEHHVIDLARAKIRTLGDEVLEVEIVGRRPALEDDGSRSRSRTQYFIRCRVKKLRSDA